MYLHVAIDDSQGDGLQINYLQLTYSIFLVMFCMSLVTHLTRAVVWSLEGHCSKNF